MRKQPDFGKLFYDYFGSQPKKVTYQVRQDANRFHDVVFLNSLLHDARMKPEEMRLRGNRLSIPLRRECWELFVPGPKGYPPLLVAQSRLTISPVKHLEWQFDHDAGFSLSDICELQSFWIDRYALGADGTMPIRLFGFTWTCTVTVCEPDLQIRLQDLEIPHSRGNEP